MDSSNRNPSKSSTTEQTKLLSSSCPREEKGKNEETGTSHAKPACFCHSCQTHWSRCRGAHDCWQGLAAVVAVSHLVCSCALNSAPGVAAWLSQALPGVQSCCAVSKHPSSTESHTGQTQPYSVATNTAVLQDWDSSPHSHELHTHTMQSLSMCQLDNVTSKARVQKWAIWRMNKLKGLIYRNIIRRWFFCFLLKFVLKNRIT